MHQFDNPIQTSPKVSVITPTFHREEEVVEAVESALAQEGLSVEIIVLDDSREGSAQAAIERIADSRVRYVKRVAPSNGKPALVRNEGAQLARGRYLYFLDDDDHVLPGALQRLTTALDAQPCAGVAFGTVVPFGVNREDLMTNRDWASKAARCARRTAGSKWLAVAALLSRTTMVINSACIIRREQALAIGGYDQAAAPFEDVDFYLRAIRRFGHVFVDYPVHHRRSGAPSFIYDLKEDHSPIADAYRVMHAKYQAEHGVLELQMLRLLGRLLPLDGPPPNAQAAAFVVGILPVATEVASALSLDGACV
jgi:glycosyltransferase involved in cell wall biosynthesis